MKKRRRRLIQAYNQTPWRKQLQRIGLFLVIVVFAALISGIYLDVSSRTTEVGRKIQHMQDEILSLERENADLESRLAFLMSYRKMSRRAAKMGFHPYDPDQAVYLVVPDFAERPPVQLAPVGHSAAIEKPLIEPAFTQSWFDWLRERVYLPPQTARRGSK